MATVDVDIHDQDGPQPQAPLQAGGPTFSSPFQSSSTVSRPENGLILEKNSSNSQGREGPHEYRRPAPTDSRSPCPALNTLANHGYIPRDGRDIDLATLLEALQREDTYHLSRPLAKFLAKGGALMTNHTVFKRVSELFGDKNPLSLHELAVHKPTGIEHDASITHRNAPKGSDRAPIPADPALVKEFFRNCESIDLAHVALTRVKLELASELDPVHAEIARGEWALVLDIFGSAYEGKIPVGALRTWLLYSRFPDGWKPGREQTLPETVETSMKIRLAMEEFLRKGADVITTKAEIEKLRDMLTSVQPYDDSI